MICLFIFFFTPCVRTRVPVKVTVESNRMGGLICSGCTLPFTWFKVDQYDLVIFDQFWPSVWRENRDEL